MADLDDAAKEAEASKPKEKMVPLNDLIAVKNQLKTSKEREKEATSRATTAETRTKIAETRAEDGDDDAVKVVKGELLARDTELTTREQKATERETSQDEREKELTVTALVSQHAARGLELNKEELLAQDDPASFASDKLIEHLEAENKKPREEEPSKSPIIETGSRGKAPLSIRDMSNEDFDKHWNKEKDAALRR